jgi:hypothetical protein
MSKRTSIAFAALLFVVLALWLAFPRIIQFLVPWTDPRSSQWGERGTFGDMFGVLNSLFSALAFCGLAFSSYIQHVQLKALQAQQRDDKRANELQTRLMAVTAALDYYNGEYEHQLNVIEQLREAGPDTKFKAAQTRATDLQLRRVSLIAELDDLLLNGITHADRTAEEEALA